MKFGGNRGNGSFGQAGPGVPGRMMPGAGMRPRGIPAGGAPMSGGYGPGGRPGANPGGGFPPGMGMGPMGPTGIPPTGAPPAGMAPTGLPNAGMAPMGVPPTGMPPAGMQPPGMQGFGGMGQYPMQGPRPMMGTQGGSIRNNLGSALKKSGFFQKDGKIKNLRGGFVGGKSKDKQPVLPQSGEAPDGELKGFGGVKGFENPQTVSNAGGGNMGTGPFAFLGSGGGPGGPVLPQARQLILESTQAGINANGIASISPDNVFTCIANLPSPNTLLGQGYGTYAAYLVDGKGQTGFLAGILRPVGNGVYQAQFRSQVPLSHYSRVMITVENPQQLGHVPQGPVILQVRQPAGPVRFLTPVKNAGNSVWKKITGLIQRKPKVPVPTEGATMPLEIEPPVSVGPVELPGGAPTINPLN